MRKFIGFIVISFIILLSLFDSGCNLKAKSKKPLYQYMLARIFWERGNLDEAITHMKKVLERDRSCFVLLELSSLYLQNDELEKAKPILEEVKLKCTDLESMERLAHLYHKNGLFEDAIAEYKKIISAFPQDKKAYLHLSSIYEREKRYKDAIDILQRLIRVNKHCPMAYFYIAKLYYRIGSLKKAKNFYIKAYKLRPDSTIFALELGFCYESLGEIDQAVALYKKVFDRSLNPGIGRHIVDLLLTKDRLDDAIKILEAMQKSGIEMGPDYKLKMGLIYYEKGLYKKAYSILSELSKQYPKNPDIPYYLGIICEKLSMDKKASHFFSIVPKNSHYYINARVFYAFLIEKMNDKGLSTSIISPLFKGKNAKKVLDLLLSIPENESGYRTVASILESLLTKYPNNVELNFDLGYTYHKLGYVQKSLTFMRKVLKLDPNHAYALNFVGYTYVEEGIKLDEAKEMIEKALAIKPNDGYIIDSLGWLYFRLKNYEKALKYLEKAASITHDDPTILKHLGEVYEKLNRIREAIKVYEKVMRISPSLEVKKELEKLKKGK